MTSKLVIEDFEIAFDHTLTFDQMVKAGNYKYKDPEIREDRFPVPSSKTGRIPAKIVSFGRPMGDEEGNNEVNFALGGMGLRRADTLETLTFGLQHLSLPQGYWVISGAFLERPGTHGRGFLGIYHGRRAVRKLGTCWVGSPLLRQWPPETYFLAVPK